MAPFKNRSEAGKLLASRLERFRGDPNVLVLALPRGGVPVALEIARDLCAPLDVFIVRKLGVPGHEELAMGAVASGGVRVINAHVVARCGVGPQEIDEVERSELKEIERREREYRGGTGSPAIRGKTVILVDDGLATGATMRAAISGLRRLQPARLVVAVPVAAPDICEEIRGLSDEMECPITPEPFYAVGLWYDNFDQTTDREVRDALRDVRERLDHSAANS